MLLNELKNIKLLKESKLVLTEEGLRRLDEGYVDDKTLFEVHCIEETVFNYGTFYKLNAYNGKVHIGVGVFSEKEMLDMFDIKHSDDVETIIDPKSLPKDVKKVIFSKNTTIVILKTGVKAISKPWTGDVYDRQIGFRVAYLKAKMKELHKELKKY